MISTYETFLIQKCTSIATLKKARQLHAFILTSTARTTYRSPFLYNSILSLYAKHGFLWDAQKVFDNMPQRNRVSYNSLISAYSRHPNYAEISFHVLAQMRIESLSPKDLTFTSLLQSASCLQDWLLGSALHSQILKFGFFCNVRVQTSLLGMYSNIWDLESANKVFESMTVRDSMTWNSMISGNLRNHRLIECLDLFHQVVRNGIVPTEFTYSLVLSACARLGDYDHGQLIHGRIIVSNTPIDLPVQNALLDIYSSCGDYQSAMSVFREIERPNMVSFNSIMAGLGEYGDGEKAMDLFAQLQRTSVAKPDEYTFAAVISAVGEFSASYYGEPFHGQVIRYGLADSVYVGSGLISMYFKNGRKEYAEQVFHSIWEKDVVLWTEMVAHCSRMGEYENAVKFFYDMLQEGHKIDSFSVSSALSACADLANLKQGEMIHSQAIKTGSLEEIPVCGCLIDMYAKNGDLQAAASLLSDIRDPDLKCCNAMIGGYSYHGKLEEALKLFDKILDHGLMPDQVTFISLLSACSHCGSVQTGKYIWYYYMKEHGVVPGPRHYSCMVSLLSRAGSLEEAKEVINESPITQHRTELWRTLLSFSVVNKDLETGLHAAKQVLKLNVQDAATYVLLSNLYAAAGRWDDVMDTRKMIRGLVREKSPGLSWIQVEKRIDLFSSGDLSHSRIDEVEAELRRLRGNMVVRTEVDDNAVHKLF